MKKLQPTYLSLIIIFYIGLLITTFSFKSNLLDMLYEGNYNWIINQLIVSNIPVIGVYLMVASIFPIVSRFIKKNKFAEVDKKAEKVNSPLETKISEVQEIITKKLDNKTNDDDETNHLKNILNEINRIQLNQTHPTDSFALYLEHIVNRIENKANTADEKASLLLNYGVKCAISGIVLYLISIICWQWISHLWGFNSVIIYGIASCSFLFLFIEFLSAWFLKQYRHFVDTSTYLIKVKSIFDKYMLLVLFSKELSDSQNISEERIRHISKIVREEIKWPDINKYNKDDISFAKEAMETASNMLKDVRGVLSKTEEKKTNKEAS